MITRMRGKIDGADEQWHVLAAPRCLTAPAPWGAVSADCCVEDNLRPLLGVAAGTTTSAATATIARVATTAIACIAATTRSARSAFAAMAVICFIGCGFAAVFLELLSLGFFGLFGR